MRAGLVRRFCMVTSGLTALFLASDWLPQALSRFWISPPVLWRLMWCVPLPAMVALFVLSPVQRLERSRSAWLASGILLVLVIGPFSGGWILSEHNQVRLGWPGLKVTAEYEVARQVVAMTEPRIRILTPTEVSIWLPTFHHHPYPVLTRQFDATRSRFQSAREDHRKLQLLVDRPRRLNKGLELELSRLLLKLDVQVIVLPRARSHDAHRKIVGQLGFDHRQDIGEFQVWQSAPST